MKLTFVGATGTVTGSKYLLEIDDKRILIDCGLFQGLKELRLRNWSALPFKPSSLDAVVLTHAHIDHSGYLPLLVKNGFKGPIYATKATIELCSILLPDSGYLQEEDAKRANKHAYSKHHPALPLYTRMDAFAALKQFQEVEYELPVSLSEHGEFTWFRAGHILGSAFIQVTHSGTRILFSGDIGRWRDPVMKPSRIITEADYLILESTYGDRLHEKTNPEDEIADIVNTTVQRGGTVLIPSFAVGRAQSILYYLYQLKQANRIPDLPIYLDSPMAIDATEILLHNRDEHQLSPEQCRNICQSAIYIRTPEESIALNRNHMPKIIISASGMMTGGRVLHHLKMLAPDHRNTVLMTGFQAEGTRGEAMLRGVDAVKIHGQMVPVKAQIAVINNASAHADYDEILIWLKHFKKAPKKVFLTHGEPHASLALKGHIERELHWPCNVPEYLDSVNLG